MPTPAEHTKHNTCPDTWRHAPHNFYFADEAARAAGTGYTITAEDVSEKRVALQIDDRSEWLVTGHAPLAWARIGAAPGGASLPAGGTTGQVLTKQSEDDGDAEWSDPTAAGGGTKTYAVFIALDNQPPAANYATRDTRNSIAVLDFDAATQESAVFVGIMPEGAVLASGVLVRLRWMATSATSGNVRWGAQLERCNTDLDSDSFDTLTEVTAAANATSGIETVTEITLTAIDSVAAGELFRLKVVRVAADATNDTMTADAELIAVEVRSAA